MQAAAAARALGLASARAAAPQSRRRSLEGTALLTAVDVMAAACHRWCEPPQHGGCGPRCAKHACRTYVASCPGVRLIRLVVSDNSIGITSYRRERNRASALEAYYRGKARRTELESQLLELKEEDAALRALAAMIELDSDAAGDSIICTSLVRSGSVRAAFSVTSWASVLLLATALGAQTCTGRLRAAKSQARCQVLVCQCDAAGSAVRIRQMLSAGVAAMEVTRRLRHGQRISEGRTYQ
jgi:hypothetical protein